MGTCPHLTDADCTPHFPARPNKLLSSMRGRWRCI
jgi:hypothetical protein